jgi:hypothetical protein
MVNKSKETIIRYVLDSSNEENERLAVFITRMRDKKEAGLQTGRGKGIPVSGAVPGQEEKDAAILGRGSGTVFQKLP